jgi:hypothetical protein
MAATTWSRGKGNCHELDQTQYGFSPEKYQLGVKQPNAITSSIFAAEKRDY